MRKKNNGPPALSDSATFRQLWDALGSKLIETAQEHLLYTQGVSGSSPLPPTITTSILVPDWPAGDINSDACYPIGRLGGQVDCCRGNILRLSHTAKRDILDSFLHLARACR